MFDSNSTAELIWALVLAAACGVAGFFAVMLWRNTKGDDGRHYNTITAWSIVLTAVALVAAMAASALTYCSVNSVQSTGVALQAQLDAQYMQDQNVLSTYVNGFYEMLGVSNLQSNEIDKILVGAVGSQVDLQTWEQNPKSSPLFSALLEAYPNVSLQQYQQVITYIQQGRQKFQDAQNVLLTELGKYDQWRETGILFHPVEVSLFGFPGSGLHVTVSGKTLTGAAAEKQMWNIVRNPAAVAAFASGNETPLSAK